jgi:hypothetical protein
MWVSPAKWGIQRAEMGVAKLKRWFTFRKPWSYFMGKST